MPIAPSHFAQVEMSSKFGAEPGEAHHLIRQAFEDGVEPAQQYLDAAKTLGKEFRYVVFGHTHHAKRVDLKLPGGGRYLNSGTWANFMRFPDDLFDKDEERSHDVPMKMEIMSKDITALNGL
jgi:UDP-2,3-diacylglucosamine pyrophosphatase LpxH